MLSARNQIKGTVVSVKKGTIMAEVVVKAGAFELVSVITKESATRMKLKKGSKVTAVIKSTEVLISNS